MVRKLPQELVDQAIDHLWNDRDSLSACSLACQAWLPSARTHLFRDQRLTGAKDCARFEALLESASAIAHYVQKLSISEPMSTAYAQNWVNRVPALVAQLHRLTTLELVGLHYVSLQKSSPEALEALSRLTGLVLADVYFDSFADVHALLSAACNVRELCFYRVSWLCFYRVSWVNPSCAPYGSLPLKAPPPLRRLVIDSWASSEMVSEWLLPSAEHLDVRTLMIRWRERESIDTLNGLLRACGPALERVYMELPTTMEAHVGAIESQELPSLYHNVNLRALEIDGLVVPGCVAWTSALLAELRAPHLETLSVSMLVLNTSSVSSFDWATLDSILSRPIFAHTTFNVNINLALHSSNNPRVVKEAVLGLLPGVVERGKLCLRCT
ncbi:uncharacterized protein TRAVEDRAFT_136855 [Trametes versicolor FP-101664 SS1]|uniref:F-box domain-containing protein n=1 Tax=Trametes versicolor (strain FP-101664) TaxID=717944 RepID=R7SA28_TRAVS|nr:uncharacterized protein TRAVEDRAFT_136855 [Trametes versicolor FP-101664 SS1]EIW51809.1 hypothetical protein TRAVEDRAFT_136855 [Trametes versicolor FP-101664 SS1]